MSASEQDFATFGEPATPDRIFDDQERALRFYTDVLGFTKKADFSNGPYRWLTLASPDEPDGTELQLALNDNRRP